MPNRDQELTDLLQAASPRPPQASPDLERKIWEYLQTNREAEPMGFKHKVIASLPIAAALALSLWGIKTQTPVEPAIEPFVYELSFEILTTNEESHDYAEDIIEWAGL